MSKAERRNGDRVWQGLVGLVRLHDRKVWYFSAGQVAHATGVCRNTAKKYLDALYDENFCAREEMGGATRYMPFMESLQ